MIASSTASFRYQGKPNADSVRERPPFSSSLLAHRLCSSEFSALSRPTSVPVAGYGRESRLDMETAVGSAAGTEGRTVGGGD